MRKNLLWFVFAFSLLFGSSSLFAQEVQALDQKVPKEAWRPAKEYARAAISCGDTVTYPTVKASSNRLISINNTTSAQALSQYFDAPQLMTIYGFDVFGYSSSANPVTIQCQLYLAGPDSLPAGVPLAVGTALMDTSPSSVAQSALRKKVIFPSPIVIDKPYVLVVRNPSANTVIIMTNDWEPTNGPADGAGEWLMSGQFPNGSWNRSYDMNVGTVPFNADLEVHPYVEYNLEADYTVDKTCLTGNDNVTFISSVSAVAKNRFYNSAVQGGFGSSSFQWSFGDASATGFGDTVSHVYAGSGPYNALHAVYMGNWSLIQNCVTDTTKIIGGSGLPTANWTFFITGLNVDFTNSSSGGTAYSWDFGDGNGSIMQNPSHVYSGNGTYNVELIISNACGTDTFSNSVFVNCTTPAPTAAFGTSPQSFQINFTDSSTNPSTWQWDFGDGSGTSTLQNPTYIYSSTGMYYVTLIVSNLCGSDTISDSVFAGIVNLDLAKAGEKLVLWPNPAQDKLTLSWNGQANTQAILTDVNGKIVRSLLLEKNANTTFDLVGIRSGMYFLRVKEKAIKVFIR